MRESNRILAIHPEVILVSLHGDTVWHPLTTSACHEHTIQIITVEGELKPLVTPNVGEIGQAAIGASQERANRRVGAEGGANTPTQAFRTGSGGQAFQGDVTQRLQYFLEQFLDLVFVPAGSLHRTLQGH